MITAPKTRLLSCESDIDALVTQTGERWMRVVYYLCLRLFPLCPQTGSARLRGDLYILF